MKKVKLTIYGMHCVACSGIAEKELRKVEGVEKVMISVMTHKAIVEAEDSVNVEDLRSAVENAGYKVVAIK
ncbi:MAG: heavy metal-associated domain-containing protein [Candidatus Nanoarchaeia archaeon]|jgi:copper chaperone CopZ|nr:heavy metal-associated domain-containing protein [Candidatus Nanoarchaeia archaeon]|tara:strand:- start:2009 stop:2221 length:213 start_codon:yes stop_codon:yes gene_type:complete